MYAAEEYRPGYNPEFLRRVREKQRREKLAKKAALPVEAVKLIEVSDDAISVDPTNDFAAGVIIGMLLEQQAKKVITPATQTRALIAQVAARRGVSAAEVLGQKRERRVVEARFDAIAAVYRARPDLTLPRIGAIFNRDHTSILHALSKRGVKYEAKNSKAA